MHFIMTLVGLFAIYMWCVIAWYFRWLLLGIAVWLAGAYYAVTQHGVTFSDCVVFSIAVPMLAMLALGIGAWMGFVSTADGGKTFALRRVA
jgi:hypothetical protein